MDIIDPLDNIFVINLKRRPERWDNFVKNAEKAGIQHYVHFYGIDGFNPTVLNNNRICLDQLNSGEIGCFCSHALIWFEALKKDLDYVIIFEDDVMFVDNFVEEWSKTFATLPSDFDIVYLGGRKKESTQKGYLEYTLNQPSEYYYKTAYKNYNERLIECNKLYFMGAFAYCISKKFMKELCGYINNNLILKSLDLFIRIHQNNYNSRAFFCNPLLAYYDEEIVSDIR